MESKEENHRDNLQLGRKLLAKIQDGGAPASQTIISSHEAAKSDNRRTEGGVNNEGALPSAVSPKPAPLSTPEKPRCTEKKRGEIVLKGERHSGTNFIERILQFNTSNLNTIAGVKGSAKFGWKHAFLPPLGGKGRPFDPSTETLVVITRDAFTWLAKMMEQTYDPLMNAKRAGGFSAFLRASYTNICQDDVGTMKGEDVCETAENLIQARTLKYKQWLSDDPDRAMYVGSREAFLQSRLHVRLEDVANRDDGATTRRRQRKFLADALRERCVQARTANEFRAVTYKTTHSMTPWHKKIDATKETKQMLAKYTKEDLRFVLSQLDLEFERKIGYDYDYIFEMLGEV